MKKERIQRYLKNNIMLLYFVISSLINSTLIRLTILDNSYSLKPIFIDAGILLLIGAFSYFIKPKSRIKYFGIWSFV